MDDVALTAFKVGDFAEATVGSDGVADKLQATGVSREVMERNRAGDGRPSPARFS